ncbi:hypothetical protein Lal_00030105 [Lupinus albus]|nr:hypothetical protein Lal_00030105 [Lupinus albus]
MTKTDVTQMNTMREVSIGTGKIFGSFAGQCGGYRYIEFSKKEMYNKIQKQIKIRTRGAKTTLEYLKEQSKLDCVMYWRHTVDEEGCFSLEREGLAQARGQVSAPMIS